MRTSTWTVTALRNMLLHSCVALFFACGPAFADVARFDALVTPFPGIGFELTANLTLIFSGGFPPFESAAYQLTDVQLTINGVTSAGADVPLRVNEVVLDHDTPNVFTPVYTFGTVGCPGQPPPSPFPTPCVPNPSLDGNFVETSGNFQSALLSSIVDPTHGFLTLPLLGGQIVPNVSAIWMTAPEPSTWTLCGLGLAGLALLALVQRRCAAHQIRSK